MFLRKKPLCDTNIVILFAKLKHKSPEATLKLVFLIEKAKI